MTSIPHGLHEFRVWLATLGCGNSVVRRLLRSTPSHTGDWLPYLRCFLLVFPLDLSQHLLFLSAAFTDAPFVARKPRECRRLASLVGSEIAYVIRDVDMAPVLIQSIFGLAPSLGWEYFLLSRFLYVIIREVTAPPLMCFLTWLIIIRMRKVPIRRSIYGVKAFHFRFSLIPNVLHFKNATLLNDIDHLRLWKLL